VYGFVVDGEGVGGFGGYGIDGSPPCPFIFEFVGVVGNFDVELGLQCANLLQVPPVF
jgi:hypothetical protein